jgi:hypothetical protein
MTNSSGGEQARHHPVENTVNDALTPKRRRTVTETPSTPPSPAASCAPTATA